MERIVFSDLWEMYRIKFIVGGKANWESFWALKGITFKIDQGETVGLIGENGAGKSTILKIIAGMLKPDRGEVRIAGKISGLLELGAGFQVELTGSQNIYLIAGLFGLSQSQIESIYNDIVNFAAIGKFINAPVKCYSQGMFVRLAFAIAIHMDPEILLIDDTLSVGDEFFQRKCIKKIFELKEQGKTIVLVTHDMNMLRRICTRAIFLKDGEIIKDGPVEQVAPLYAQASGAKAGVVILEKQPLQLIFNNGHLFINWQDRLLTPNSGIYTTFFSLDKWYSSFQADWQVKKEGQNKLVATGLFYPLNCVQTWKIEISDNSDIIIDIEMDSQESLQLQEGCLNIVLSDEYQEWFSDQEQGEFPLIEDQDSRWEALVDEQTPRKCVGVKINTDDLRLPSLVLEPKDNPLLNSLRIFNGEFLSHTRILQHRQRNLQNFTKDQMSRLKYFSGKIRINTANLSDYLDKLQQSSFILDNKMKLKVGQGKCSIYYENKLLTKANQATVLMNVGGRLYSSDTAYWEIVEKDDKKIILRGSWSQLPVIQVWRIKIIQENVFTWEVDLEVAKEVDIEKQYLRFECTSQYDQYYSEYGAGKFPNKFLESEIDILQRCVSRGEVGLFNAQRSIVPLTIKFDDGFNNFFKILNSDIFIQARELRINKVVAEENIRLAVGKHPSFRVEVSLNKNELAVVENDQGLLSEGRLEFIFDKGKTGITWQGVQLTKGLGLYTSLRSGGRWHDSSTSAIWHCKQENRNIIATAKWAQLPLRQFWQISLRQENIIELIVKMIVDQEIEIDRMQTNIMLSEIYKNWLTNNQKGLFSDFDGSVNDDWQVLWSNRDTLDSKNTYIGVTGNYLKDNFPPEIKLIPEYLDANWHLNILNSDLYHRGRVLQFLKEKKEKFPVGEYLYFKGKILIGDK